MARWVAGVAWSPEFAGVEAIDRALPEEIAVSLCVNGVPAAVVIASPGELCRDLGLVSALTEELWSAGARTSPTAAPWSPRGASVRVDVRLSAPRAEPGVAAQVRSMRLAVRTAAASAD